MTINNNKRRNTAATKSVMLALEENGGLMNQEMIESSLATTMENVPNRSTIYRILDRFCNEGLAHSTVSDSGVTYYALCEGCNDGSHHHEHIHFQCENCEKLECLEEETSIKLPQGYRMREANLWVRGLCADCHKAH
jgi:Fur family ferric uptake transcriptional regulator